VDWQRLERVSNVRNDIEHYYSETSDPVLRGLIADSFVLVRDFMARELHLDPVDALGHETWERMLAVAEVFERERRECSEAMQLVKCYTPRMVEAILRCVCEECRSPLLAPLAASVGPDIKCRSCGNVEHWEPFADRAFREQSSSLPGGGGGHEYISCPFCMYETYILAERCCAVCGQSCAHECKRCESDIPPEELSDEAYCGYCRHIASKE
jgi:hypothetical protein